MVDGSNPFEAFSDEELRNYLRDNGEKTSPQENRKQLLQRCMHVGQRAQRQVESRLVTSRGEMQRSNHGAHQSERASGSTTNHVHHAMPEAGGVVRRALVIGVNYFGTRSQLQGCINDSRCMHYLLTHRLGFREDQVLFMTDDHPDPMRRPTKANIFNGIRWLTTGLRPGQPTSLFFSFSGHGSQQRDYSGQESDGLNETILPLDHEFAGQIVDDDLNRMLINPLPQGTKLHAVVDACHSGTVFDLPFQATCHAGYLRWELETSRSRSVPVHKGTAGGFAVQFGASRDHQVAADTTKLSGGVATGAATFAFISALERRGLNISYGDVLVEMYNMLQMSGLGSSGGGGGGLDGILFGMLGGGGGGRYRGQEPVMGSAYNFDLKYRMEI